MRRLVGKSGTLDEIGIGADPAAEILIAASDKPKGIIKMPGKSVDMS